MDSKRVKTFLFLVAISAIAESAPRETKLVLSHQLIHGKIQNLTVKLGQRFGHDLGFFPNDDGNFEIDRVVGGEYASEGQFPFMAAVHRLLGKGLIAQCGGTILNSRWVLTAGHCIAQTPRRFYVIFGVTTKAGMGYDYNVGSGLAMMTAQGALHPQYKSGMNDIGLLYMPKDIPFTSRIQPIVLPSRFYLKQTFVGWPAIVIGWGRDEHSITGTKRLKYAILRTISNSQCSVYWNVNEKNICTAAGSGHDACQGDSGGPLLVTEQGQYVQIGIVSYGDADCPSSRPGVFTRITPYLDWIDRITRRKKLQYTETFI